VLVSCLGSGAASAVTLQHAKIIVAPTSAHDHVGHALASSGNTLLVGAPDADHLPDLGCFYLFVRDGSVWNQKENIPQFKIAGAHFGASVAISGETLVTGALYTDSFPAHAGEAYIYAWNGIQCTFDAKVQAAGGFPGDGFGEAVAVSGDTVLVGAPGQAAVWVFQRFDTGLEQGWALSAKLTGSVSSFGAAVVFAGNRAVIGAPDAGLAFVYERSGVVWTQQATLVAADGATDNRLGTSLSLSGEAVLVGAPRALHAGIPCGAAYVFGHADGVWTQQRKLVASDAAAQQSFGSAVSLSGNTALVGAPGDGSPAIRDAGAAYVFSGFGTTWTEQAKFTAPDAAAGDRLGGSVCIAGVSLLAGADHDSYGSLVAGGSVREFRLSPCAGSITDYGAGCSGSGGHVPQLSLAGCPAAGATLDLDITGGLTNSIPFLVVGLAPASAGLGHACVLGVAPAIQPVLLPNLGGLGGETGAGLLSFPVTLPVGGVTANLQVALLDDGSPLGFVLTNSVEIVIP
jgi:hypothetical protein